MNMMDFDLVSIQEARILAENAAGAQRKMAELSQEALDRIVEGTAAGLRTHARELAALSVEETDIGNREDKELKNRFVCEEVPRALHGVKCVGIIAKDPQARTMEVGVPRGVVVALCPVTSPVSTAIYKTLIAIKSGNSIIVSPHPRAKRAMTRALDYLISAAEDSGLPPGAVSYLSNVSFPGTRELMYHDAASLILMTGVPSLLPLAETSGKPVLYGGTGGGPAFIERTADLRQAARDIVRSKTFDFGASAGEQSLVVDAPVSEAVKQELGMAGAYFLKAREAERLESFLARGGPTLRADMAGKPAAYLAKAAGLSIPEGTRLVMLEHVYVSEADRRPRPLCPVLDYYVEQDWRHACEKCLELLLGERRGHTLTIHSRDPMVIEQFALKKPVARVLVNTPAAFGGIGMTTNLFPAMTLGGGSAGMGETSDNVSPFNLIYRRKIGAGVRSVEDWLARSGAAGPPEEGLERFRDRLKEFLLDARQEDRMRSFHVSNRGYGP